MDSLGKILAIKLFFNVMLAVLMAGACSVASRVWVGSFNPVSGVMALRKIHPDLTAVLLLSAVTFCLVLSYVFTYLVLKRGSSQ